jgi:hypothetical protein
MITSMSSPDRAAGTNSVLAASQPANRAFVQKPDQISTESAAFLKASLSSQPEVRPDVVARAKELAADPNYPSAAIMKNVAGQILGSPDLSEDES